MLVAKKQKFFYFCQFLQIIYALKYLNVILISLQFIVLIVYVLQQYLLDASLLI